MILFIDTADYNKTRFALVDEDGVIALEEMAIPYNRSFSTLGHITKILEEHGGHNNLARIVAASGPGAFTGLRVGLALAQGLSVAWQVPVVTIENEKTPDDLTELLKLKDEYGEILYR